MATYDLDRVELNHLLTQNIDPAARASVIDYLLKSGIFDDNDDNDHHPGQENGWHKNYHQGTINVEISNGTLPLDPQAQVLALTTANNVVSTTDTALKVIVENVATDSHLTVSEGNTDVMIVTGRGNNFVELHDSGNDIILAGGGNDTVKAGAGADSVYGGGGNDSLVAGTGSHQLLVGGDGSDTLHGGDGAYDTLMGGDGADTLYAGNGAHQLLIGGNGNDVFYSGASGDTMEGGNGDDVFYLTGHNISDTIDGGAGHDTVKFEAYATHDIMSLHTNNGVTIIEFKDGQTVTVSHVENLVFTDKTEHLP